MRRARWVLLSGGLLLGALLVLVGTPERPHVRRSALWFDVPMLLGQTAAASELQATAPAGKKPFPEGTSAPAATQPPPNPDIYPRPRWERMRVALEVLVDGRPLRTVEHAGRTYLPVPQLGVEYEIRIWNHGSRRITAIVSVDGLSVINGRPASEAHPGYIVDPRSSIVIRGWRRDMDTVAAFSFEERDKSYASRVGRPDNIGVLGLIAIEEMTWRPMPRLEQEDSAARSAKAGHGAVGGIGTGYGRDIDSGIHYVPFVRSGNKQTITHFYDTMDALRRAGIPIDGRPHSDPFPGDSEFVPRPPGSREK